jgi:hypothetical protein
MIGYYQAENFKIFQALSKTKIPYAFNASQTNPGGLGGQSGGVFRKILRKLYPFNLSKLTSLFYKPILASLFGIRAPNICILGGENTLKYNGTAALIDEKTELMWAHDYDYDEHLNLLNERKTQENFAVFVDPGGTDMFIFDALLPNARLHLTSEHYYPSLCRFLDYVEKELEIEVVIAAHPKANHIDYPEYFGKRRTLKNQTIRLIQKSKFVISHQSTALSYVVLAKKPLLLLTSAGYEDDLSYSKFIEITARALGTNIINIDKEPYPTNWEKELAVNEAMYLKYKQLYIKKDGSEELNTWQIFSNLLKK